jgi:nicotinate phosphoribosyltransferase
MSKTIIFSDSLDKESAYEIFKFCSDKIKCSPCIGTYLSNDVEVKPLNMVIKMSAAKPENEEWIDTIKLSDSAGKHTGNEKQIEICKFVLGIK